MKPRARRGIWLLRLAVLGAAGWLAFERYAIYLPGILSVLRDPIVPDRIVVWQDGPRTAPRPPAERSPSVIVLLADELGYDDLTVPGGGVPGAKGETSVLWSNQGNRETGIRG